MANMINTEHTAWGSRVLFFRQPARAREEDPVSCLLPRCENEALGGPVTWLLDPGHRGCCDDSGNTGCPPGRLGVGPLPPASLQGEPGTHHSEPGPQDPRITCLPTMTIHFYPQN